MHVCMATFLTRLPHACMHASLLVFAPQLMLGMQDGDLGAYIRYGYSSPTSTTSMSGTVDGTYLQW